MINIGWTYVKSEPKLEVVENLFFEPEKISDVYKDTTSLFKKCPANTSFLKSFFCIKSPVDLYLKYNRQNHTYEINQSQNFVDSFFDPRLNDFDRKKDKALVSLKFMYMFVSDEPVWIETYPAFLHGEVVNTRFVNGGFDIYKWQRPVDFSFEILDDNRPVQIKRGQPLFYVKFIGQNFNDDFKLKKIQWTNELLKTMRSCQPQNFIQGLGWKLMQLGNKNRPKKLVK